MSRFSPVLWLIAGVPVNASSCVIVFAISSVSLHNVSLYACVCVCRSSRWEYEAYGRFSMEGAIELARSMGLIKFHQVCGE